VLKVPTIVRYQRIIVQECRCSYPSVVNVNRMPATPCLVNCFSPLSAQRLIDAVNHVVAKVVL
jgi:hypothetical protein